MTVAVGLALLKPLSVLVSDAIGQPTPIPLQFTTWPLRGTGHTLARLIADLTFAIHLGLTYLIAFLVLRLIVRIPTLAMIAFVGIWTSVYMQYDGMTSVAVAFLALALLVKCVVVWRAGLLSLIVILLVERILLWPMTLNVDKWYFSMGVTAIILTLALAAYSAYVSIGGRVAVRNLLEHGRLSLSD